MLCANFFNKEQMETEGFEPSESFGYEPTALTILLRFLGVRLL